MDIDGLNAFLIVSFIASILGNALVLIVRLSKAKRTTMTAYELLICHLAVTDLQFALYIPIMVHANTKGQWQLGQTGCKMIFTWSSVALNVSIMNVVVMGYERYRSLCNPLGYRWSHRKTAMVLLLVWVYSLVIQIPTIVVTKVKGFCYPVYPNSAFQIANTLLQFAVFYILPVVLMTILNVKVILAMRRRLHTVQSKQDIAMPKQGNSIRGLDNSAVIQEQSVRDQDRNAPDQDRGAQSQQMSARDQHQKPSATLQIATTNNNLHPEISNLRLSEYSSINRSSSATAHSQLRSFSKQYRSVFKILTVLTLTHMFICLPNHIYYLSRLTTKYSVKFERALISLSYMIFLNSCVNPVIYSIFDRRFRKDVRNLFKNII